MNTSYCQSGPLDPDRIALSLTVIWVGTFHSDDIDPRQNWTPGQRIELNGDHRHAPPVNRGPGKIPRLRVRKVQLGNMAL